MPDDVAIEKVQVLEKLGARVERVRPGEHQHELRSGPASYVDEKQFVVSLLYASAEFRIWPESEPTTSAGRS
jgi:cysteine synthase A